MFKLSVELLKETPLYFLNLQVLQDQLKAVKKELEHYKGLEDREKKLQEEVIYV